MERVKFATVGLLALLFLPLLGLSASVASANPEIGIIDLRHAIKSGRVSLLDIEGNGCVSGPCLDGVLRNNSIDPMFISTRISDPMYFKNKASYVGNNFFATEVHLEGGSYLTYGESSFIQLPPKSDTSVTLIAYSTSPDKNKHGKSDAFFLARTPKNILNATKIISTFESERSDLDTTKAKQIAFWLSRDFSEAEIADDYEYSEYDFQIASAILGDIANEMPDDTKQQPSFVSFIWKPNTFLCGESCVVDDISFAEAYPVAFYQTDAFAYTVIATSIATAATITFVTAGAGAPALAPGTGWLVVLAGGGGQGAYMAGLSTIGSLIGSNAIGGAAIVNSFGAVVGLTATAKSAAFGGLALKTMFGVSVAAYDGILIGQNEETEQLTFVTEIRLPNQLGSGWVRELAESVYENEEKAGKALNEGKRDDFTRYLRYRQADLLRGVAALENCWTVPVGCAQQQLSRDDLITLSIMAYKAGEFDLFHRVIEYVKKQISAIGVATPFLDYLYATSLMMQSNFIEVPRLLRSAVDQEPNVIEPTLLYIVYLAEMDFAANESLILSMLRKLEKEFDDDDYDTAYSIATAYFRVGHIYASNGSYKKALKYFGSARDALNFLQKWPIFSGLMDQQFRQDIELAMAIAHFRAGEKSKAKGLFDKLYKEQSDPMKRQTLKNSYMCSTTPDEAEAEDECKKAEGIG